MTDLRKPMTVDEACAMIDRQMESLTAHADMLKKQIRDEEQARGELNECLSNVFQTAKWLEMTQVFVEKGRGRVRVSMYGNGDVSMNAPDAQSPELDPGRYRLFFLIVPTK